MAELGLEVGDRPGELEEVERLLAAPAIDETGIDGAEVDGTGLVDLRHLPFVTIDNADSRDLDQALHISVTDAGYRVDYALADAAYYVRPGSALFDRSLRRGASFYFPDRAIPMLPEALSEGLISLNPDVDRRAVVLRTELDSEGGAVTTHALRARIRSRAKLAYDQVSEWFEEGGPDPELEYAASLVALKRVGELRIEQALSRGVVPYDREEVAISISDDGEHVEFGVRHRGAAQGWNEQLSLLCNTEGARLLARYDALSDAVQSVYRIHYPPVARRLEELRRTLDAVVQEHQLDDRWRWDGRRASLADYLTGLPDGPQFERLQVAVERQILWTNRASEYSEVAGPHYALAVEPYVRLSSPMREVVGIFTHKELAEAIGWEPAGQNQTDIDLREAVIATANRSREVQKRIEKSVVLLALDELFADDLSRPRATRPRRTGAVVGVRSTRLYVLLDESLLEVKVYVDDLERRHETTYTRTDAALVPEGDAPRFRLGDGVSLVVESWDKGRNRFVLDLSREST